MDSANKKGVIGLIVVIATIVVLAITMFICLWFTVLKVDVKLTATQIDESQNILLQWDTDKSVDKIEIELYHGKELVSKESILRGDSIVRGFKEIEAYYGKFTVKVTVSRGIYFTTMEKVVKLTADEYNFAPLTSTMPVTMFTLSLEEITDRGQIPTFVWSKRSGVYDYSKLPENVFTYPGVTQEQILNSDEYVEYDITSKYIKELYELNHDSKFNIYLNDWFAWGALHMTTAIGLPKDNYTITFLADGAGVYTNFNNHFNHTDHSLNLAEYEDMKEDYNKLIQEVKRYDYYQAWDNKFCIKDEDFRDYVYVMVTEETNVEWWVTRTSGTMAMDSPEMYALIENNPRIKVKDLKTLLSAFSPRVSNPSLTDNEVYELTKDRWFTEQELLELYKFNKNMFGDAVNNDKEVMVILGTWDVDELEFDAYVRATMAYYGDDYVFYYKGHPKTPTQSISGKEEHLNDLGITDIDSTIPAELIFFFNPDAFVTGYTSSTFDVIAPEKCCGLFIVDWVIESDIYYEDKLDFYLRHVDTYGNLTLDADEYILEFKGADPTYDIAVYDDNTGTITYYNLVGTDYVAA